MSDSVQKELRRIRICLFAILGVLGVHGIADADASYRPAVAVQDEGAISCGNSEERHKALEVARQMHATTVRINAIENMNPIFQCDPIGAIQAVTAEGFRPYVTVVGGPRYARWLAKEVGPLVGMWGVWNEPTIPGWQFGYMANSKGPSSYRKLYQRVSRVLRSTDPGSKVLIGEIPPVRDTWFLSQVAGRRKPPVRSDGIALHAYRWTMTPELSTSFDHLGGYLRMWRRLSRRWARERRLCRPALHRKVCRPVPIYITEAGFLREPSGRDYPIYGSPTVADLYVRSWRVACQRHVRMMFHYQLIDSHQKWDSSLIGEWGPRPEFEALKGYIRNAKGCKGRAGRLGPERGPPVAVFEPERPAPVLGPPPVFELPTGEPAPPDVPVVVEPEPDPPRVEPEPVVEEPAVLEPEPVQDPEPPLNPEPEVPMN